MNWLFWLTVVSGIASIIGLVLTIILSLHGRRVAKENLKRFHNDVFRNRVGTVLMDRKRSGRSLNARDVFYIVLAIADELGIRRPNFLHLLKPILFGLIEHTLLMAERDQTLTPAEKTTVARSLRAIMKEISSWETTPPGSIREFGPVRWMEFLGIGGCIYFVLAIVLSWFTKVLWWNLIAIGGWFSVYVLLLENMQFVEQEYKFIKGDDSSSILTQAKEISDVVSISDTTTTVTWKVKPKSWWMRSAAGGGD